MKSREEYAREQPWWFDWDIDHFPNDFHAWIMSINRGFENRIKFEPFEIYKRQAERFTRERKDYPHDGDKHEKLEWLRGEKEKFCANSLYYVNNYGWLKEGTAAEGRVKFEAFEAQAIICFLIDMLMIVVNTKARQIGFTSVMSLISNKLIICFKSFFIKYVAQDDKKTAEIFEDKVKFSFGQLEKHIRPNQSNDNKREIKLGKAAGKGDVFGMQSKIAVGTAADDSINGGSPTLVLVDEAGEYEKKVLEAMIQNGQTTLFGLDIKTRKQKLLRQMFIWGTGGSMDKGGGSFAAYAEPIFERFARKDFVDRTVPLFFDYMARPGMTKELYESEKRKAYATQGEGREKAIVRFHQQYPRTLSDVFMTSDKTLIPKTEILEMLDKIYDRRSYLKYGYFVPVYDETVKYPETYVVPYRIKSVTFVETDEYDPRTTVCIAIPPTKCRNRYYKGTDPINSETGNSEFSSTVWDKKLRTTAACLKYRESNYKNCYVQSFLLSMYYGQENGEGFLKELIENVIGDDYRNTLKELGFNMSRLVMNSELPAHLRQSSEALKLWGISNKSNNAGEIMNMHFTFYRTFFKRIYIPWYGEQLKNFVEKKLSGANPNRETRFQSSNKDRYKDDCIYSGTFAYICASVYNDPIIENSAEYVKRMKSRYKVVQNASTGYQQKRILSRR